MPSPDDIVKASVNNVAALFVVGLVAVVIASIVALRRPRRDVSTAARVAAVVTPLALIAGAIVFVAAPGLFQSQGHGTAATALFAGILAVVVINAIDGRPPYRASYGAIAIGMPVSAVIAYLAGGDYWVFWVEFVLIVEFAIFWAVQTWELRNQPVRDGETVMPGIGRRTVIRAWPTAD